MQKKYNHLTSSINEFSKEARKQEDKGIKKYGQPLDPMDEYDWLAMAKEELADAFKYFHAEEVKRNYVICEIRKMTNDDEIVELLNYLQGGVYEDE